MDKMDKDEAMQDLKAATAALRRATKAVDRAREALQGAIRQAAQAGARQTDIVEVTGYTREHVRRLTRD